MRINCNFYLPPPPTGETYYWRPIVRLTTLGVIPFGYEEDEKDYQILNPVPKELEALEYAKKLVKEYSYEEVSNWLYQETGRKISKDGLRKRIKIEHRRKKAADAAREFERQAKEAARKAEEIERTYGGYDPTVPSNSSSIP